MKNCIKYFTKEVDKLYFTSLEIYGDQTERSSPDYMPEKKKQIDDAHPKNDKMTDNKNFIERLKENIYESTRNIDYEKSIFKEIENKGNKNGFESATKLNNSNKILDRESKEEILKSIKEEFEKNKIELEENQIYNESYGSKCVIKRKVHKVISSSLIYLSKVDLVFEPAEIDKNEKKSSEIKKGKAGIILKDKNGNPFELDFREDILKIWRDRTCFYSKNHLLLLIETNDSEVLNNFNEFIRIIKLEYDFRNVSLYIFPNLDSVENEKISYFNKHNFIGNKITIFRDFHINLISNVYSNIESMVPKKQLNNYSIMDLGYDIETGNNKNQKKYHYCSINYPNGQYYEGQTNKNKIPHGFGTMTYMNSTAYCGYFNDNKREGIACFLNSNYTLSTMIWSKDIQNGFMIEYSMNEKTKIFEGIIKDGKYNGPGIYIYKNNLNKDEKFKGFYSKGKKIKGSISILNPQDKEKFKHETPEFLEENNNFLEVYKGEFYQNQNETLPGQFGIEINRMTSAKSHIGSVYKNDILNKISLSRGMSYADQNFRTPKGAYNITFGTEKLTLNYEKDPKPWKISKTAKNVCTQVRLKQSILKNNNNKFVIPDTANGSNDFFTGYCKFISEIGDEYIGDLREYLPCYLGLLYRKNKDQYELGFFDNIKLEGTDVREYFLKKGLIIQENSIQLLKENTIYFKEAKIYNYYYDTIVLNTKQSFIYTGILEPIYAKRSDGKEIDKNNVLDMKKVDCKGNLFFLDSKKELKGIFYQNEFKFGMLKDERTIYNGSFKSNSTGDYLYHGYGTIKFLDHNDYNTFTGEFREGEINGYGEMQYKNGSFSSGIFKRYISRKMKKLSFIVDNISNHLYYIVGNSIKFYPTMKPSVAKGFNNQNNFVCENVKIANLDTNQNLLGFFNYNYSFNLNAFELSKSDPSNKITNQIILSDQKNQFEIIFLNIDENGKVSNFNLKMTNDSVYYGNMNDKLQMVGVGRLKKKNEDVYIGNFDNNKFNGIGHRKYTEANICPVLNKLVKLEFAIEEKGIFLDGKFDNSEKPATINVRTRKVVEKKYENLSIKNCWKEEKGHFKKGHLIKGNKISINKSTEIVIGQFYVPKINPLETYFPANKYPVHSIPFCVGVSCLETQNDENRILYAGRIVASKQVPGKLVPYDSAVYFYDIKGLPTKIKKKSMINIEYRIRFISQCSELEIEPGKSYDAFADNLKILNGKIRIYDINKDLSPSLDHKSTITKINNENKIIYEGDIIKGRIGGKGILYYENGDIFIGDIRDTFFDPLKIQQPNKGEFGTFIQPLVGIQTGFFEDQVMNGRGISIFQNGIKYKGEMLNGKAHGKGYLYFPDGTHFEGMFINEKMIGHCKFFYPDGNCLQCTLDEKSDINGNGVIQMKNGTVIEGQFIKNELYGLGTKISKTIEISGTLNKHFEPFGTVCINKENLSAYGEVNDKKHFKGKIVSKKTNKSILVSYAEKITYDLDTLTENHKKNLE